MINEAVLATVAYFDVFDFPLTKEEIFKYLWKEKAAAENLSEALKFLVENKKLDNKSSFYFFPGREEIINKRQKAIIPTERKIRRAKFAAKLISWLPFVRAIFICNSVAGETAVAESDIDFFIVTAKGRLWFVRFFTNLILKIFRLRTNASHDADKICLSFYASENSLDFSSLLIAEDDIYFAVWVRQLYPVYDPCDFKNKIVAENKWIDALMPNLDNHCQILNNKETNGIKEWLERFLGGRLGDFLENNLRKLQWLKLPTTLKEKSKLNGVNVVLNENFLKMHENDARVEIREKWLKKVI